MKTEDNGNENILQSLSPPSPVNDNAKSSIQPPPPAAAMVQPKRTVCDHCRRRRIRCDGKLPCQPCINASLVCKRDHVPLKRGPKRGRGRVINELRERYSLDNNGNNHNPNNNNHPNKHSRESSSEIPNPSTSVPSTPLSPPPVSDLAWQYASTDPRRAPEPTGSFSSDQFRPMSRNYTPLAPKCIEYYYEYIYPIMPLPYMPEVRDMVARSPTLAELTASDRAYMFALCALTCFHMSGQNITTDAPTPSWEVAGRFFLDECIAARQSYDFFSDLSLHAVISSFWLSTSFFEINQSRKSWLYLREAVTLAQEILLHDDTSYIGLEPAEVLCRQRVFWQLFVTERKKPITLKKTPSLPTTRHPYEAPGIHSGFLQLISSYVPLNESFVNAWNEGNDPQISAATYLALQKLLDQPPAFLTRAQKNASATATVADLQTLMTAVSSPEDGTFVKTEAAPDVSTIAVDPAVKTEQESQGQAGPAGQASQAGQAGATSQPAQSTQAGQTGLADNGYPLGETETETETTAIQKADLLITQQWLRLIVWQSSLNQGLLSRSASDECMRFTFPMSIASRTAAVLQSLPPQAIEVHGMGIFEKIFEIVTWCMSAHESYSKLMTSMPLSGGGIVTTGMDFAASSDLGVLGVGRMSAMVDPLEFFVRTLSASPNSRTQYAERLLMFASEHPTGMRMALSPALSPTLSATLSVPTLSSPPSPEFTGRPYLNGLTSGSVLGEVGEVGETGTAGASAGAGAATVAATVATTVTSAGMTGITNANGVTEAEVTDVTELPESATTSGAEQTEGEQLYSDVLARSPSFEGDDSFSWVAHSSRQQSLTSFGDELQQLGHYLGPPMSPSVNGNSYDMTS